MGRPVGSVNGIAPTLPEMFRYRALLERLREPGLDTGARVALEEELEARRRAYDAGAARARGLALARVWRPLSEISCALDPPPDDLVATAVASTLWVRRTHVRGHRPAWAMCVHSYAPYGAHRDLAAGHGLECELLPFSWRDTAIAVVYSRPMSQPAIDAADYREGLRYAKQRGRR